MIAEQQEFYAGISFWGRLGSTLLGRVQKDDGAWTEWSGGRRYGAAVLGFKTVGSINEEEELQRIWCTARCFELSAPHTVFDQRTAVASFDVNDALASVTHEHQQEETATLMENAHSSMYPNILDGSNLDEDVVVDDGLDSSGAADHPADITQSTELVNSSIPFDFSMPLDNLDMGLDISMPNDDLDFGLDFNMPTINLDTGHGL